MKRILCFICCLLMLAAVANAASVDELSAPRQGDITLWTIISDTLDTHCMTASGAAAATGDVIVATAFTYVIDNRLYSGGNDTHDISAMGNKDTIAAQAINTFCRYVFSIDADATVDIYCGTPAATAVLALYPAIDEGVCPFSSVIVATNSTVTFTVGTTAFATPTSATFEDLYALPSQAIDR